MKLALQVLEKLKPGFSIFYGSELPLLRLKKKKKRIARTIVTKQEEGRMPTESNQEDASTFSLRQAPSFLQRPPLEKSNMDPDREYVCQAPGLSVTVWLFEIPWTVGSPPGSAVHGILQARILEGAVISFSRGSSWPRDQTWSPSLQADPLVSEPPGKPN